MLTLTDSEQEASFRAWLRDWAEHNVPQELRWQTDFDRLLELDKILSAEGLIGIGWPTELGGRGASALMEAVFSDELGKIGVRLALAPSHNGANTIGPTLMVHGTEEQRARFLPEIIGVRELWCQGFSETEAGSDMANIRTTAVEEGDGFVINGSKVWTSFAHRSDWMFALVRTGDVASRHKGLTFLLLPMSTEGITVRPIRQITGTSEFAEVFFNDVYVDRSGLVGEVGDGWRVAMTCLSSERLSGRYRYSTFKRELDQLATTLSASDAGRSEQDHWLAELGDAAASIYGIEALSLRVDSIREAGGDPGVLASVNKLWWPVAHQRLTELGLRMTGELRTDPDYWYETWLGARAESIYGGSAQIQRNIIAERHLGMPRHG